MSRKERKEAAEKRRIEIRDILIETFHKKKELGKNSNECIDAIAGKAGSLLVARPQEKTLIGEAIMLVPDILRKEVSIMKQEEEKKKQEEIAQYFDALVILSAFLKHS